MQQARIVKVSQSVSVVRGASLGLKVKPPFVDGETSVARAGKPLRGVVSQVNGTRDSSHRERKEVFVACVCGCVYVLIGHVKVP